MGFLDNRGVHVDDEVFWRKDGSSFPVEYWSHPLMRDGKTVGAVVTFFDIGERRRAEDERRKSEDRKCTVLEINNAIISNLTQEALFASVYEAIRPVIAFDRAAFLLYQPESKTLKLVSMDSERESEFFRVGKEYQLHEAQMSAWVLENQEVVTRGDLEHEPRTLGERRLVEEGIQSYCVVPLVAMGTSIGTFTLWSEVPPLRERRDDISQLAMFFLSRYARNLGKRIDGISTAAKERLTDYSWPGNIRELQNVIERALILCNGPILELDSDLSNVSASFTMPVPETIQPIPAADELHLKTLQEVEREHIVAVLEQTRGVIEGACGAAKTLGLHPNTLRHRMEKLGIKRSTHRIS